jgi:hypothetical protein
MIRRRHNTRFVFILFQVAAVAIICFGSLINFHQYKIWGKPLIPSFVGYKRDIEKYSKVLSFSKFSRNDHFTQNHFSGTNGVFPAEAVRVSCGPGSFIIIDLSQKVPNSRGTSPCGLRGPPVS